MSGLPTSWADIELSVVAQVTSGIGFPNEYQGHTSGDLPFFKVSDISHAVLANRGELKTANHYVSHEVAEKLKGKPLAPGSTVFAKIGEAVRLNRRATVTTPCLIDNNVMAVKARDGVDDRYVHQFLRTIDFGESARSTTVPSLRKGDVEELRFPLAPAAEQKRIADKLDTVLTRVDAVNTRLARVAPLLKRFRQSVLAAATSGRLRNPSENVQKITPIVLRESECKELPKGWAWRQLTSLARLESGHTPRKSVESYWAGGDVPWISLQDIREADGKVIFDTKFHPTNDGIANSSARLVPVGTVCFCRDISFGYVTVMGKEMATSQHFANWVCGSELLPIYLMYAFIAARDSLAMSGQGSTVTTIYMPALKALKIAVPPIHEQTEIVRRVETLFAFADRLEARLAQAQTAATRLTPALLAKAFRGELVPQDPNDEPAAELLRRLQAQRATAVSASKTGTGRGRGRTAVAAPAVTEN